jgi:hypothetical protein
MKDMAGNNLFSTHCYIHRQNLASKKMAPSKKQIFEEITKHFKEANIKNAFRTKNTIQNLVKPRPQRDEYEQSGVYQMRCMDCPNI